ncbi:hypothetical protein ACLOJK_030521 [Asimina triloba]
METPPRPVAHRNDLSALGEDVSKATLTDGKSLLVASGRAPKSSYQSLLFHVSNLLRPSLDASYSKLKTSVCSLHRAQSTNETYTLDFFVPVPVLEMIELAWTARLDADVIQTGGGRRVN